MVFLYWCCHSNIHVVDTPVRNALVLSACRTVLSPSPVRTAQRFASTANNYRFPSKKSKNVNPPNDQPVGPQHVLRVTREDFVLQQAGGSTIEVIQNAGARQAHVFVPCSNPRSKRQRVAGGLVELQMLLETSRP